jgi:hypothetical protein
LISPTSSFLDIYLSSSYVVISVHIEGTAKPSEQTPSDIR